MFPLSLEVIGREAFLGARELRSAEFEQPSKLKQIGSRAFELSGLENFVLPAGCAELGAGCFQFCGRLEKFEFGENSVLTHLPASCFATSGLKEIEVPENVETIGEIAFLNCKRLRSAKFAGYGKNSSKLNKIGRVAFSITALESVKTPKTVKSIGESAFAQSESLRLVKIENGSQLQQFDCECVNHCQCEVRMERRLMRNYVGVLPDTRFVELLEESGESGGENEENYEKRKCLCGA